MKKTIVSLVVAAFMILTPNLAAQSISDESLQASSQDSLQTSSEDSLQSSTEESSAQTTEESSANTTDNSFQYSTDQTTGASSEATTQATTDGSDQSGDTSAIILIVAGAVVAIGLTAVGVTYLVRVSGAEQQNVLALQDEIYDAEGVEYRHLLATFGIGESELVRANDKVVVAGHRIECDQDAADYLVALIVEITEFLPPGKLKLSAVSQQTALLTVS